MNNKALIENLVAFYITAEKLKTVMRHSYTSNTARQESTAEHSWMVCLIAMTVFEHISLEIDQLKVLKMLVIHDLAEALTGDVPAFDTKGRIGKYEREKIAFLQLIDPLPKITQENFLALWEECEANKTNEAKVVHAIDKYEAPLQHNIFGADKWDQNDFDFHSQYKMQYHSFEPFMKELREELDHMSRRKITQAKQLHRLPKEMQKLYQELNKTDEK